MNWCNSVKLPGASYQISPLTQEVYFLDLILQLCLHRSKAMDVNLIKCTKMKQQNLEALNVYQIMGLGK